MWSLTFAKVSGDSGVLWEEDEAAAWAEWAQSNEMMMGRLPGVPQHWWFCPELLHGLESHQCLQGWGLLGALITGWGTGELQSEFEQHDLSHCLYYSSGITLVATYSFKATTSNALWIQTQYRRNPDFIQEEIKLLGKIKNLTALQPGIKLSLTATAETGFSSMQIQHCFYYR